MIADSFQELNRMAKRIGVQQRWLQASGRDREHYDVCLSKRKLAIKLGAIEITTKELIKKIKRRERNNIENHPDECECFACMFSGRNL